ncbi:DUF4249 family protein [Robiginitalea sp. IMCC44478]|uniref:DUF4249 family protein n=1 Tax=Robiginitalea sp. IMCC44478 TaxID=3459122 RepID=UPI00404320D9
MRTKHFYIAILLALGMGCEDVIEVDTPSEAPRLVVEGLLRVDRTEPYIPIAIRVTETTNFFGTSQPVSDLESIVIITEVFEDGISQGTGVSSLAELQPGSGIYEPDPTFDSDQRISTNVLSQEDVVFTLIIRYNGRGYAAQTRFNGSVPITSLELGENTLFDEDETELKVRFRDQPDEDNFYILDFGFGNYLPTEDTFYKGQLFEFSYFYDQQFEAGTTLEVGLLGADLEFYNYMNLLVEQSEGPDDPFQTPVATVRGNVFDITDLDNLNNFDNTNQPEVFPLGYFAIVEEYTAQITIQ